MKKRIAMSTIGYAIVLVMILGVVMILSAPMLVTKYKDDDKVKNTPEEIREPKTEIFQEIRNMEERLNSRIDNLERTSGVYNKYVCTIEGNVDENGDVVPVNSPGATEKFVFVCEYK